MYPVVLDEADRVDYLADKNPCCRVLDIRQEPGYVYKKISQLVDCKLGVYVIKRLVDEFTVSFECSQEDIIADVRGQFREKLGLIYEILP